MPLVPEPFRVPYFIVRHYPFLGLEFLGTLEASETSQTFEVFLRFGSLPLPHNQ
jgi:hypothetical protein